jgi:multidrug efflux pump subunit AcrA (membrane-fusion protein)
MNATRIPAPRVVDLRPTAANGETAFLSLLLECGRRLREAGSPAQVRRVLVDETCRVGEFGQVILLAPRGRRWKLAAVSSVAAIDPHAPLVAWLETALSPGNAGGKPLPLMLDGRTAPGGYPFVHGMLAPLSARGRTFAWLAALSVAPLSARQAHALDQMAHAGAHALAAAGGARAAPLHRRRTIVVAAACTAAAALMFLPVPMTVLAPAEVVARDAEPVAAPMEGVIERLAVAPNGAVRKGDLLFAYDRTDLANLAEIARRTLETRRSALRRAEQDALGRGGGRELAEARAEHDVARAELDRALERFERAQVRSPADGVAIIADREKWIGRPVRTGERVLLVADPARAELRAEMAVGDSIEIGPGAPIRLFLDADPLRPVAATLISRAYQAARTDSGGLAFALTGAFDPAAPAPRLGLRGTAQVSGERVALAYFLFRRPIAAARQWLGL